MKAPAADRPIAPSPSWFTGIPALILWFAVALPAIAGVGEWERLPLGGGFLFGACAEFQNSDNLLATEATGIFVSQNNGLTWQRRTGVPAPQRAGRLRCYPLTTRTGALGTGFYIADTNSQIQYSEDLGQSWTPLGPPTPEIIRDLILHEGTIIASTALDIYRLSGDQSQWLPSQSGIGSTFFPFPYLYGSPHSSDLFATRSDDPPMRSIDGGLNWTPITNGFGGSIPSQLAFDADAALPTRMYALNTTQFFRSDDGGNSWAEIPVLIGGVPVSQDLSDLYAHPATPDRVYLSTRTASLDHPALLLQSDDGGDTWSAVSSPLFGRGIGLLPNNRAPDSNLWAVRYPGFLHSPDGGNSWFERVSGIDGELSVADMGFSPDPAIELVTSLPGGVVQASPAPGRDWSTVFVYPGNIGDLVVLQGPGPVLIQSISGGLLRSGDGGVSWSVLDADDGLTPGTVRGLATTDADPNRVVVTVDTSIYSSDDRGLSWTQLSTPSGSGATLAVTAIDHFDAQLIYVTGNETSNYRDVWRSVNGGQSWLGPSRVDATRFISNLVPDPHQSGTVYAVTNDLHRSDDSAATWTAVPVPTMEPQESAESLFVDRSHADRLALSSGRGVQISPDRGQTWLRYQSGLVPSQSFDFFTRFIAQNPMKPNDWYLGTWEHGLWYLNFDQLFSDQLEEAGSP